MSSSHLPSGLRESGWVRRAARIFLSGLFLSACVGHVGEGQIGQYRPARIRAEFIHPKWGDTPYHLEYSHFPGGEQFIKHEQFAYSFYASLLAGMKNIPAGGTNLLHQSLGMYATTMSHNHPNNGHSFFVVGNAGGRVKSNRILVFGDPKTKRPTGKPHNDLLVSMLQGFGYGELKTFGSPDLVMTNGLPGFI